MVRVVTSRVRAFSIVCLMSASATGTVARLVVLAYERLFRNVFTDVIRGTLVGHGRIEVFGGFGYSVSSWGVLDSTEVAGALYSLENEASQ